MNTELSDDLASVARIVSIPKILEVVCRTTGLGFSAVARVTDLRWIACAVRDEIAFGLPVGGELPVQTTICDAIRRSGEAVVINSVAEDPVYSCHPTPKMYGFQSYASFPIRLRNGRLFGTLCAIDPRPALLKTPAITSMFTMFADLIGMQIDANNRMLASEAELSKEREQSHLREQFIAVLGHDLRNPLAAIASGVQLLRHSKLDPDDVETLDLLQRSVGRMSSIINNVVDLARSRLGGGLTLSLSREADVAAAIHQAVGELQASWPDRMIDEALDVDRAFPCDCQRIAQMLSNLVANALAHGDQASPVGVRAQTTTTEFELSVTNLGKTIPPEVFPRLFQPFVRGDDRAAQQGLGLGLYIASEIARAHQGFLNVTSSDGKTCFTFRMPIPADAAAIESHRKADKKGSE